MPLIRPGIAALAIFSFISGWGAFVIPYTFITDLNRSTLAAYLNGMLGATAPINYSTVAAVGLFQLIPVLIFFIFTQEYLLNIFAGGTKGGA
jgi:inositol-phosphate transport system permease protein